MISLSHIHLSYDEVLYDNARIDIQFKEITLIKGKSGCGKTSLLNLLGLFKEFTDMDYIFNTTNIKQLTRKEKDQFRRRYISFVFQDYPMLENITCNEYLELIYLMHNVPYTDTMILERLKDIGLADKQYAFINALSGGEKQRLCIIGALIKKPLLILLDEPTASLDSVNTKMVFDLLNKLKKELNIAIVVVSHEKIENFVDHVYYVENKKIIEKNKSSQSISMPSNQKEDKGISYQFYTRFLRLKYSIKRSKANLIILIMFASVGFVFLLFHYHTEGERLNDQYLTHDYYKLLAVESMDIENNDQVYSMLSSIKGIDKMIKYPIQTLDTPIKVGGKTYELDSSLTIYPYYYQEEIEGYIYHGQYEPNGIYISSELHKQIGKGELELTIAGEVMKENISGVIDSNCPPLFNQNSNYTLYVPRTMLKENPYSTQYLVIVDNVLNKEDRISQIDSLALDLKIEDVTKDISYLLNRDRLFQGQMKNLLFVLMGFTLIGFIVYNMVDMKKQQEESYLLKSLGLTKSLLYKLYLLKALYLMIIGTTASLLVYQLGKFFIRQIYGIVLQGYIYYLFIIIFIFVGIFGPNLHSAIRIDKSNK